MKALRRRLLGLTASVGGAVALVPVAVGPAFAGDTLQQCIDRAASHDGEPPTCTKVNGSWVASWPGDDTAGAGGGFGSGLAILAVMAVLIGVAVLIWRVTTARRLATDAGLDPGLATQMTLLSDDGLDATYLAASLRQPSAATPAVESPGARPTADRLRELASLRDQGLVTDAEYEQRRKDIIDGV